MSFSFGAPQATSASTGFAFGVSNPQQAAPAQQSVAPLGFGSAAPPSLAPAPAAQPQTSAISSGGLTFGISAPPYGAQTATSAAPSLTFGLGTAATAKYVVRQQLACLFFVLLIHSLIFLQLIFSSSISSGLTFGASATTTAQSAAPAFGGFSTNLSTTLNKTTIEGGFGLTATTTTATLTNR